MRICILLTVIAIAGCTAERSSEPGPILPDAGGAGSTEVSAEVVDWVPSSAVYACESGNQIEVTYPSRTRAVLLYNGEEMAMTSTASASGARYAGVRYEWWSVQRPTAQGTLYLLVGDGLAGPAVENCVQQGE